MRVSKVIAAVLCLPLIVEAGLAAYALRSKAKARALLTTVDSIALGKTSQVEFESKLKVLGLPYEYEACSAIVGTCQGIAVIMTNYPQLKTKEDISDQIAAKISIFRPTGLAANVYFQSTLFDGGSISFGTEHVEIETDLSSTMSRGEPMQVWQWKHHTGTPYLERAIDPAHDPTVSFNSLQSFDLGCMNSFRGCDTDQRLWPVSSRPSWPPPSMSEVTK